MVPCAAPIAPTMAIAMGIAMSPTTGAMSVYREVDLSEEQDEHDPVGEHARPRHLDDDVAEIVGGEEVGGLEAEEGYDEDQADDDRQHTEVSGPHVVACSLPNPRLCLGPFREPDARHGDVGLGAHVASSGTFSGTPATRVGIPAVIACTTSCCVVVARS